MGRGKSEVCASHTLPLPESREMATTPTDTHKRIVTIRVAPVIHDEVKTIAARESESESTILRRLIRVGLDNERRSSQDGAR
jgi:hypothetical protein